MRLFHDCTQAFDRHMGVDLGRTQRCMSEQLLHRTQIGSSFENMGRRRVAQIMRTQCHVDVSTMRNGAHNTAHGPNIDTPTPRSQEQGQTRVRLHQGGAAMFLPTNQRLLGRDAERHHAFPTTFAEDSNRSPGQIHIIEVGGPELAHSNSRAVKHLQHGVIAKCYRILICGSMCSLIK